LLDQAIRRGLSCCRATTPSDELLLLLLLLAPALDFIVITSFERPRAAPHQHPKPYERQQRRK
jgi:hypothetical protein